VDVLLDPGFGFNKSIEDNFQLLRQSEFLKILEKPLLYGLSRKSMIYKTLGISPEQALNGTSILNTYAVINGAKIIRVHDVLEAQQLKKLIAKLD
jgi:dihydropteroate synthase